MNLIRGALLAGRIRSHGQIIGMTSDDQRNTLINTMASLSNQSIAHYQSLNDTDLAGVAAVMLFLRLGRSRTDAELKTMSDDDKRNTLIVGLSNPTLTVDSLQGLKNIDLVMIGLGNNAFGVSLETPSFIQGILLIGQIRTFGQLLRMTPDDQRNTLIVEMAAHSNQSIAEFQGLNDFRLADAGAAMLFLRFGGIRNDADLRSMSVEDQRNTAIVEVDRQTHLGGRLQGLRTIDVVTVALGADPTFFVPKPPIEKPDNPDPELGDPTGAGKDKPDPPNDPPPEEGPTKNPDNQPPPPEGGCFIGDTPVLMADGLTKRIDAIAIGDQVMARDEKTGLVAVGAVDRVFRHHVAETLLLQMDGGEVVETTAEHRFAAEERGFVSAGQLRPGDRLSTHNERGSGVVSTGARSAEVTVYNLSVGRFHTFFIGGAGLWVHNLKKSDPPEEPPPQEP